MSATVREYRSHAGRDGDSPIAVLVQRLILADAALRDLLNSDREFAEEFQGYRREYGCRALNAAEQARVELTESCAAATVRQSPGTGLKRRTRCVRTTNTGRSARPTPWCAGRRWRRPGGWLPQVDWNGPSTCSSSSSTNCGKLSLATGNVTDVLVDGRTVTVDGSAGIVEIHSNDVTE
jgi:hypothetical protein